MSQANVVVHRTEIAGLGSESGAGVTSLLDATELKDRCQRQGKKSNFAERGTVSIIC